MRGHSNGMKGLASPDRGGDKIKASSNTNHHNKKNSHISGNHQNDHQHQQQQQVGGGIGGSGSSETAHEGKKGGLLSGNEPVPVVWPPKFVIALTNKEKEEDFLAIKGSKLPQRPKKRAKLIQRTVNLVCPGSWLCDQPLNDTRFERIKFLRSDITSPFSETKRLEGYGQHGIRLGVMECFLDIFEGDTRSRNLLIVRHSSSQAYYMHIFSIISLSLAGGSSSVLDPLSYSSVLVAR